jgi:hypothetical protein
MKDNNVERSNEYSPSEYEIGQWLGNTTSILSKFLEKPLSKRELILLRQFVIEGIRQYEHFKEQKHQGVKTDIENGEWPHLFTILSFLKHYGIDFPTLYENINMEAGGKQFNPFGDIEAIDLIKSRLKDLR